MNRLIEIKDYIERESSNLRKSQNRARSAPGIQLKRELLLDALQEYENTLESIENLLPTRRWNKITDEYERLKTRVSQSLKILDGTAVIEEKGRSKRRHSDYYVEVVIPESRTEFSLSREESLLSSTRLGTNLDETNTTAFKENLEDLKKRIFT